MKITKYNLCYTWVYVFFFFFEYKFLVKNAKIIIHNYKYYTICVPIICIYWPNAIINNNNNINDYGLLLAKNYKILFIHTYPIRHFYSREQHIIIITSDIIRLKYKNYMTYVTHRVCRYLRVNYYKYYNIKNTKHNLFVKY